MTISGCFPVVGELAKFQQLVDSGRGKVEIGPNSLLDFCHRYLFCSERFDEHTYWLSNADGVRQLKHNSVGKASIDDALCNVARNVSRRTVNLCRVFAAKCSAAVGAHSAIGVDNDFSSCDARVALRTTDLKSTRWVDVIGDISVNVVLVLLENWIDHMLSNNLVDPFLGQRGTVLSAEDDRIDSLWRVAFVCDRNL